MARMKGKAFALNEDTPKTITFKLSDVELSKSQLSVRVVEGAKPQKGKVNIDLENSRIIYEPEVNYNGNDQFQLVACEIESNPEICSIPVLVPLIIAPVNDAPVAAKATLEIMEDSSPNESLAECTGENLKLRASDVDLDELTFSVENLPGLKLTGSCLTYTPEANFAGTKTTTYTVTDKSGLSSHNSVNISVAGREDPTEFLSESLKCSGNEDEKINCQVQAIDADGPVTYSITSTLNSEWKQIDGDFATSGKFNITPPKDFNGAVKLKVIASGAGDSSAEATLNLNIKPVYDAPYWTERPELNTSVTDKSQPVALKFKAVSPDKLPITYTSVEVLPEKQCTLSKTELDSELLLTFNCINANQSITVNVTASDGTKAGVISEKSEITFASGIPYEIGPFWHLINDQWQETSSDIAGETLSCIKFKRPPGASKLIFDFDMNLYRGYLDIYRDGKLGPWWSGVQAQSGMQVDIQSVLGSVDICHYRKLSQISRTPEIIIKSIKFE